jgi:uncharacterized membrane protein
MKRHSIILWLIIILGIILRLTDIGFPEFATDEAQLALGKSAAWTPLVMQFVTFIQNIFGYKMIIARSGSVIFGIGCLPIIYLIVKEVADKNAALISTALAAIIPTHIVFSKLAYPSVYLCFAWLLTTWLFLKARKQSTSSNLLIALFLSSVLSTFIKTQGLLLPFFLLIATLIDILKKRNYQLPIILILSLIPVTLYILTKPGVFATLFLYGGNMYGVSDFLTRITGIINLWWHLTPLFLMLFVLSLISLHLKAKSYKLIYLLIFIGIINGLLLGPAHEYYTTHHIYWCIPIGIMLAKWKPCWSTLALGLIAIHTIMVTGPRDIFLNANTHSLYKEEGYWNQHEAAINDALKETEKVIVLGFPGHHIRWYLDPEVLVGRNMDLRDRSGTYLLLDKEEWVQVSDGDKIYEDEEVMIVKRL